jgi:hypothetical protein
VPDDDDPPVRLARATGAALAVSSLLLLGFFGSLVVHDRSTVVTLLIVFALVTVPALAGALLGVRAGAELLRGTPPEKGAAVYGALVALGSAGVVALSLQPGLDRRLHTGDLVGGGVGAAALVLSLLAVALLARWRTLAVRLVAASATAVLVLAVLAVRAVSGTR